MQTDVSSPSLEKDEEYRMLVADLFPGANLDLPSEIDEEKTGKDGKLRLARKVLRELKRQVDTLERLLDDSADEAEVQSWLEERSLGDQTSIGSSVYGRVIEGVFDGEQMIGEDGRRYVVPANYASKSKLVEGDLLRLTITDQGRFLYKQKGPIERQRFVGTLAYDDETQVWKVLANGGAYKVLPASISYYQGEAGDEVVILVPANTPSRWAAVENIIKQEI